jgi:16S rRNA processing protein RimM
MTDKQFVEIGFTKKTHGVDGELKVAVEPNFIEDFLKAETVFLEVRGKKVPYFIASVRGVGADPIVKLEDVDTREAAQMISSKPIFLRESDILDDSEREIPQEDSGHVFCVGYTMVDATLGEVGKIKSVEQMPAQEMAVVETANGAVYVPLIEAFIQKIDKPAKRVFVDLPEGLLEVGN